MRLPLLLLLSCAPVASAVVACGGGSDDVGPGARTTLTAPAPGPASPERDTAPGGGTPQGPSEVAPKSLEELLPPDSVPRRGTGEADPADVAVVERWAATLRKGDVAGAARFWAVPSVAQNLSPLLRLRSRADLLAFNAGLTCGAVVSATAQAGAHLVVDFLLTTRTGGDPGCRRSAGAGARVALRIEGGRISAWHRIPDDDAPGARPLAPAPVS